MIYNSNNLILNCIEKEIKNEINDEILLLIFDRLESRKENIKKDFENSLQLNKNCFHIIDLDNLDNLDNLDKNSNIILFTNNLIDINKIANTDHKILFHIYLHQNTMERNLSNLLFNKKILKKEPPAINKFEECLYFIQKRNPIEVIVTLDYTVIRSHIFSMFIQKVPNKEFKILNNLNILQSKRFIHGNYYWRLQIEKEIELLCQKKILTSRLAIAIYRATTLKFNDSNTCIGNFYNENLGIKSSSFHLTNIIVKSDIKYVKLKVYHLDKSLLFK